MTLVDTHLHAMRNAVELRGIRTDSWQVSWQDELASDVAIKALAGK
jgi:hypothetical protein